MTEHTNTKHTLGDDGHCTECGLGMLLFDALKMSNDPLYLEADKIFSRPRSEVTTTDAALLLLGMANIMAMQGDVFRVLDPNNAEGFWEGSDLLVMLAMFLQDNPETREDLSTVFKLEISGKYTVPNEATSAGQLHTNTELPNSNGSNHGPGFYL